MKKLIKIVVWLVIIVVLIVATLPLWISPIVSGAVKVGAPKVLGVNASLGGVSVNPFTGTLAIKDLQLVNPVDKGYSTNNSFSVAKIEVVLAMGSMFSNPMEIKKIEIADPRIRYEVKGTTSNFSAMLDNIKSAPKEEKKPAEAKPAEKKEGEGKKVVIDEVSLHGAQVDIATIVTLGAGVPVPLPPITLHDIGKKTNGTSWGEAIGEIFTAIINGASALGTGALKVGEGAVKGVGEGLSKGVDALGAGGKSVESAGKAATKVIGSLFGGSKDEKKEEKK